MSNRKIILNVETIFNCKKTFLNNLFQLNQYKIIKSFDKINNLSLILVQVGLVQTLAELVQSK